METVKEGKRRLFEEDRETSRIVSEMFFDILKRGMDAVREYSRKFDDWDPASFELNDTEIRKAMSQLPARVIEDTDFCQQNVREFARAAAGNHAAT